VGEAVNGPDSEGGAAWSADGRTIVFHRDRGGVYSLWMAWRATPDSPFDPAQPIPLEGASGGWGVSPMLSFSGDSLLLTGEDPDRPGETGISGWSRQR
jgi:hypothetical protein